MCLTELIFGVSEEHGPLHVYTSDLAIFARVCVCIFLLELGMWILP